MSKEYEIASVKRRFLAFCIDFVIIFLLWYLITTDDLAKVNNLLKTLDPEESGSLEIFIQAVFKMYVSFFFKWFFISVLTYTLIPAIIGKGKTIGKLLVGISLVSSDTGEEISPTKLFLREAFFRNLLEVCLVIPGIISIIMMIYRSDSKMIHDYFTKSIVIRESSFTTY